MNDKERAAILLAKCDYCRALCERLTNIIPYANRAPFYMLSCINCKNSFEPIKLVDKN